MQSLTQVDICNVSLMRLGQRKIQAITDQSDPNAIACLVAWNQALGEVSRETPWNCLMKRACLAQMAPVTDTCCPSGIPPQPDPWVPATAYAVNDYVTYAGQLYQCLIANTSSGSFTNDLTRGFWFETIFFYPNYLGPFPGGVTDPLYGWAFGYLLPTDFILLVELNGVNCWNNRGDTYGSLYEIYGTRLFTNAHSANAKFVRFETDTTKFDALFTGALTFKLAALIATTVRKDDADLSLKMEELYQRELGRARVKDAGEQQPRRYNIVSQSRFVASRRRSTNG